MWNGFSNEWHVVCDQNNTSHAVNLDWMYKYNYNWYISFPILENENNLIFAGEALFDLVMDFSL